MTTTIRAQAQLFQIDTQELLADGIAVIWGDPDDWGGIFEVTEAAASLAEAVARPSFTAHLHTHDGRQRSITITSSEFNADDAYPLTFQGEGDVDSAEYHAFSTIEGRMGMAEREKDAS